MTRDETMKYLKQFGITIKTFGPPAVYNEKGQMVQSNIKAPAYDPRTPKVNKL